MQKEIAEALARYDDALKQAAEMYRIEVMPALDRYHAATAKAKEVLQVELEQITRKEPKP